MTALSTGGNSGNKESSVAMSSLALAAWSGVRAIIYTTITKKFMILLM
jgi:hypothetical protein